jgi:hypothetical protein
MNKTETEVRYCFSIGTERHQHQSLPDIQLSGKKNKKFLLNEIHEVVGKVVFIKLIATVNLSA